MKYAIKYKDPRWQKKRLEVMQRDGFQCLHCGNSKATLNVHHSYYVSGRDIWDYDESTLLTLCEPCHRRVSHPDFLQGGEDHPYFAWNWEEEAVEACRLMIAVGPKDATKVSLYASVATCEAVQKNLVKPEKIALVISMLCNQIDSKETFENLAMAVEAMETDRLKRNGWSDDVVKKLISSDLLQTGGAQ